MPTDKSTQLSQRRHVSNRLHTGKARTLVAKSTSLLAKGQSDAIDAAVNDATVALDKAAQKGSLHPNNAARRKSRLIRRQKKVAANSQ